MNNCSFVGRIGRDAVTRSTQNSKATGWALAVDVGFGDHKQTLWLDCTLWGDYGEKTGPYIKKGDRLGVTGEVGTREYDGKTFVTLNVHKVDLMGSKKDGDTPARTERANTSTRPASTTQAPPSDNFEDDDIPF